MIRATLSKFPRANDAVKALSLSVAIAFAIALVPLAYRLVRAVT